MQATNLDDYFRRYGPALAARVDAAFRPLHDPAREPPLKAGTRRTLYPAQAHAATGVVRGWQRHPAMFLCGECGTGKTTVAAAAVHAASADRRYRALVMCPDHLVEKWVRELHETLPDPCVVPIDRWEQILELPTGPPLGPDWYVLGRNRAKWLSGWRAAYWRAGAPFRFAGATYPAGVLRCPSCGAPLVRNTAERGATVFYRPEDLGGANGTRVKQKRCSRCAEPLWQYQWRWRRWSPAKYLKDHRKGYFDAFVLDEMHEEKARDTLQALAAGGLIAACRRTLAMTGTLIGGKADHLQPILFRLAARPLVAEGLAWEDALEFSRRYGRVDRIETIRQGGPTTANGRGSTRSQREQVQPGIMPTLYGRHLVGNTVFVSLDDVSDALPPFYEQAEPVALPPDLEAAYVEVETRLRAEITDMLRRRNTRLLGKMLHTLLAYPDHPYDWKEIGYHEDLEDGTRRWKPVVTPPDFGPDRARRWPKEQRLLEICRRERAEGRQVWLFCEYTKAVPVQARLEEVLREAGFRVKVLRDTVDLRKREAWIAQHGPGTEVMLSHPKLVETGLDLFSKDGAFNFASLVFYETGYNLFTLRQASRRARRLAQWLACRVYYLYYTGTMQERAMGLMGRKLDASLALEGKFSAEGLAALAETGGSEMMELARSLAERLDPGSADPRTWAGGQGVKDREQRAAEDPFAWMDLDTEQEPGTLEPVDDPFRWLDEF